MTLLLKNLLFTVVVPGTVAVYVPLLIARGRSITSTPLFSAGGAILVAAGAVIYAWCLWNFASFGRGTPLPMDAPKRLVIRGLYRYTRNPMYLGVIIAVLGWAAGFASTALLGYGAFVALICHAFVVLYEEPRLHELFGAQYDGYRMQVGRWLPRGPRSPAA
jgi:protein-S-isoprenylcysteine O-methyltransferase Ste14